MSKRKQLGQGERALALQVLASLRRLRDEKKFSWKGDMTELGADLLGISSRQLRRYSSAAKAAGGDVPPPAPRGRPPMKLTNVSLQDIRSYMLECNAKAQPVTLSLLQEYLSNYGIVVSKNTIRMRLRKAGVKFGRGKRRNIAHEAPHTVAYRARFLRIFYDNLDTEQKPLKPLVFLDESYVNENHVSGCTWFDPDTWVSEYAGKGRRFCIFGAIVFTTVDDALRGAWVEKSLQYWPADRKVPKSTGAVGDDYHGNIDGERFGAWFSALCTTLKRTHGPCEIIMDGASYHKVAVNRAPTKSTNKADMKQWLTESGITFDDRSTRAELLVLINKYKEDTVRYVATDTAKSHGHNVSFLPPYHCELNPIEMIWAAIKNPIRSMERLSMQKLGEAIARNAKVCVTQKVFTGSWNRMIKNADDYLKAADADEGGFTSAIEHDGSSEDETSSEED